MRVPFSELDIEVAGPSVVFDGEYISASSLEGKLTVKFAVEGFNGPILSKRLNQAARHFKRSMVKAGANPATAGRSWVELDSEFDGDFKRILTRIDRRLREIAGAPVPPRTVESCLGITGGERNRWMKDGRLPACQSHRSNRTQATFNVHYFPAALVNELAARPEIIGRWREQDKLDLE